jgi:hypothetical protein
MHFLKEKHPERAVAGSESLTDPMIIGDFKAVAGILPGEEGRYSKTKKLVIKTACWDFPLLSNFYSMKTTNPVFWNYFYCQ